MKTKLTNIILIDDSHATNVYHEKIIEKAQLGVTTHAFTLAKDALEYFQTKISKLNSSLIFLDINMPEMDGWEFLEVFGRQFSIEPTTIVVMLTTSLNPDESNKAKDYSFVVDFLTKPLKMKDINQLISKYFI